MKLQTPTGKQNTAFSLDLNIRYIKYFYFRIWHVPDIKKLCAQCKNTGTSETLV